MYTSTKRSSYISQTTDLVSITVFLGVHECTLLPRDQITSVKQLILLAQQCFFGRARMYTSTKRSSYISQTTDLVSITVFLGVHECTLLPRDQITSVKQLILLAQQCFFGRA